MIFIERAQIDDASELIRVKTNAFKEEANLYGSAPACCNSLENQIKSIKEHYCYKILDENKIIGGMEVRQRGEGYFRIAYIFVDLEYQNKGIGSMAMKFLEDEFPEAQRWILETSYLSYRNHHFYEKLGFVKIGESAPKPEKNGFYVFVYEKVYFKEFESIDDKKV